MPVALLLQGGELLPGLLDRAACAYLAQQQHEGVPRFFPCPGAGHICFRPTAARYTRSIVGGSPAQWRRHIA